MKFTHWPANLISGGELVRQRAQLDGFRRCLRDEMDAADHADIQRYDCVQALDRIAALETPRGNATVRKMARIAREARG